MSLSKLYIYESVHGADSLNSHVKRFSKTIHNLDLVGLELPTNTNDMGFPGLFRKSPGTWLSMFLHAKIQHLLYRLSTGSSGSSEFAAGRKYAEEVEG